MLLKLVDRIFRITDRSRARDTLQEFCDKRVEAKRKLAQIERDADRALAEARKLEEDAFRIEFEKRDRTQPAYLPTSPDAGKSPTPFDPWAFTQVDALPAVVARLPRGKPTVKPQQPFAITALWREQGAV